MIDLYQFSPMFGVANLSPHCMKLEAFLRISEIPHQVIEENDPRKGPKGKLPFIRDNGVIIGDSELIIDYLETKLEFDVDGHLDSRRRSIHHAFMHMLDDHLYWALLYSRWIDEHNWETLKAKLFAEIPPPISTYIGSKMRKNIRQQLDAQGLGRHSREELYQLACKDLEQLSVFLADNKWFGGDYVSKLDLAAVAYLSNIMVPEMPSPLAECVKQNGNLETYTVRASRILFPELNPKAKSKPSVKSKSKARL